MPEWMEWPSIPPHSTARVQLCTCRAWKSCSTSKQKTLTHDIDRPPPRAISTHRQTPQTQHKKVCKKHTNSTIACCVQCSAHQLIFYYGFWLAARVRFFVPLLPFFSPHISVLHWHKCLHTAAIPFRIHIIHHKKQQRTIRKSTTNAA